MSEERCRARFYVCSARASVAVLRASILVFVQFTLNGIGV
jgi:hypothetical protein